MQRCLFCAKQTEYVICFICLNIILMTSRKCIACFKTTWHGSQCIDNVNPKHTITKTCVLGRPGVSFDT
jgi:hypothetical protein